MFKRPALNLNNIENGKEQTGTATLATGRFELSCLVVEEINGQAVNHYEEGMYALLIVG